MKKFILLASILLSFTNLCFSQFVEERKIEEDEVVIENQKMKISVFDESTHKPLVADVAVKGLNPRKAVVFNNIQDTIIPIQNYRIFTVSCIKKDYMIYSEKFWPDEVEIHEQKINLRPLDFGLKQNLPDIYFIGDKTQIYPKSKAAIDKLIEWLRLNPTVKISIIGHVNGPHNDKSERYYQKASYERAKAVVKYMVDKGVNPSRLVPKGAGNTEMIYPDPTTSWQAEANRRIEIEVLGF